MKELRKGLSNLIVLIVFVMMLCLVGCSNAKNPDDFEYYYMSVNRNKFTLVKHEYAMPEGGLAEQTDDLIHRLMKSGSKDEIAALPGEEILISWVVEEAVLKLYFSAGYNEINKSTEAISRAAVVNTMCQIEGIDLVEYYVAETPLTIDGNVIGTMKPDDFVSGLSSAEGTTMLTLYFPDESMEGLVKVVREVEINNSSTAEETIVNQLIKGPIEGEIGVRAIPDNTKIKTIVTKDMICYVTFNAGFLEYLSDVPDNFTIYSIVNTLCNLRGINNVVIKVDGLENDFYNSFDISDFFAYNHDLVLDSEE